MRFEFNFHTKKIDSNKIKMYCVFQNNRKFLIVLSLIVDLLILPTENSTCLALIGFSFIFGLIGLLVILEIAIHAPLAFSSFAASQ